jgi:hypothetical protein
MPSTRVGVPAAAPETSRFAIAVVLVTAVAVAARVLYVAFVAQHHAPLGFDSTAYYLIAGPLARGHGYSDGVIAFSHHYVPTANYPPLYPLFLAALQRAGLKSVFEARVASSIAGAATVPLAALVGRRLAGARVGIVAAALVALWPFLVATDGSLMSETIAVPLVTGALLATLWAREALGLWRWAVVGALFALGALARAEAPLLMVIVIGAALLATRELSARTRIRAGAAALAGFAVISAPWVGYVVHEVGAGGLWATDSAKTLAGANCPSTYYGPGIGLWDSACTVPVDWPRRTEREAAADNRERAQHYARAHVARAPLVAAVRVLRTAGLYAPRQQHDFEVIESRNAKWQTLAWWCYVAVLPLAAYGLVLLLRRRHGAAVIVAAIVGVAVASAISDGNERLRMVVEPQILVAAATAFVALEARLHSRSRNRNHDPNHKVPEQAASS